MSVVSAQTRPSAGSWSSERSPIRLMSMESTRSRPSTSPSARSRSLEVGRRPDGQPEPSGPPLAGSNSLTRISLPPARRRPAGPAAPPAGPSPPRRGRPAPDLDRAVTQTTPSDLADEGGDPVRLGQGRAWAPRRPSRTAMVTRIGSRWTGRAGSGRGRYRRRRRRPAPRRRPGSWPRPTWRSRCAVARDSRPPVRPGRRDALDRQDDGVDPSTAEVSFASDQAGRLPAAPPPAGS